MYGGSGASPCGSPWRRSRQRPSPPVPSVGMEETRPIAAAIRDGLREEAAPISRRLAEVKGLANGTIRRLEQLEADVTAERHARVDDLALLVELITGQWRAMNE